jgi:hypothetical protein
MPANGSFPATLLSRGDAARGLRTGRWLAIERVPHTTQLLDPDAAALAGRILLSDRPIEAKDRRRFFLNLNAAGSGSCLSLPGSRVPGLHKQEAVSAAMISAFLHSADRAAVTAMFVIATQHVMHDRAILVLAHMRYRASVN